MTRIRKLILFNLGFLWFVNNVFSDVVDLKNFQNAGFTLTNSKNNGFQFTEIGPNGKKGITQVVNGSQSIWECDGMWMCVGVVLIESPSFPEPLMYIKLRSPDDESHQYYLSKNDEFYQVDSEIFNEKLIDTEISALDDGDGDEDYDEDGTTSTQDNSSDSVEEYYEKHQAQPELSREQERPTKKEKKKKKKSGDDSSSSQDRILDIKNPGKNSRVKFEYDMMDGVPSLSVTARKNKKVSVVCEGGKNIWEAESHQRLLILSCHAFYAEYRLLELFYTENDENYNAFFKKQGTEWIEIEEDDYISSYNDLKSQIVHIDDVTLNISNIKNTDKFYLKEESNDFYHAFIYFPITGYHLTRVVDAEKQIWSSDSKRCIAAIIIKHSDQIKFLKLEILNDKDQPEDLFFKFSNNNYQKISEEEFENLINKEEPLKVEQPLQMHLKFEPEYFLPHPPESKPPKETPRPKKQPPTETTPSMPKEQPKVTTPKQVPSEPFQSPKPVETDFVPVPKESSKPKKQLEEPDQEVKIQNSPLSFFMFDLNDEDPFSSQ